MLLLLESKPFLGKGVYDQVISDVIAGHWGKTIPAARMSSNLPF
jgi:hypothetical protein